MKTSIEKYKFCDLHPCRAAECFICKQEYKLVYTHKTEQEKEPFAVTYTFFCMKCKDRFFR